MRTEFTISGFLVGTIWMPAAERYKPLNYTFVRDESERSSRWQDAREDLREAMCHVTNDGDFQSCAVADGILSVKRVRESSGHRKAIERHFPLVMFPSIADMVRVDWAGPDCEDE